MKARWIIGMVVGFFGLLLGVAGQLHAQSGAIYACVNNSSGEVKIVAPGSTCKNNWTLVTWDASRTEPAVFAVNCDDDKTIQGALRQRLIPGDKLLVSGTCNENVNVSSPAVANTLIGITLDGHGSATIHGDTTQPTVSITASGITIKGFTITGGQHGIRVTGNNTTISGNTIDGAARDGIVLTMGGAATIDGNTVQYAGRFGINLDQSSAARIVNNTAQNNTSHGILVDESSSGRIGFLTFSDTVAAPNTIVSNGGSGVAVVRSSSAVILGNTISGNTLRGIDVFRASHADIGANTINANGQYGIFLMENSSVNLGDTGIAFDGANSTTSNNGVGPTGPFGPGVGLRCRDGGVARVRPGGNLGSLNGVSGAKDFGFTATSSENPNITINSQGCIDRAPLPPTP